MVVDDEKDIVSLVEKILTEWGYRVDIFTNPIEALHEFEQTNSFSSPAAKRYDLRVLDIRMPAISGIELATRAKEMDRSIKIILMTAFEPTPDMLSGYPVVRYDALLKKPFALDEICAAVHNQLAHERMF